MADQPEADALPAAKAGSPFADLRYGADAEHGPHVIHSQPRWSLEENQRPLTGYLGAGMVLLGCFLTAAFQQQPHLTPEWSASLGPALAGRVEAMLAALWHWRHALLIVAIFSVMFVAEIVVFKTHRRHFDFGSARKVDAVAWARIWVRWVGMAACVLGALFFYAMLNEYNLLKFPFGKVFGAGGGPGHVKHNFYDRYVIFLIVAVPMLLTFCVPYFWMVERHARAGGPVDEFLVLGLVLRRISHWMQGRFFEDRASADAWSAFRNPHVANLARAMLVKIFFVPLMMTWALDNWGTWETTSHHFFYAMPSGDFSTMQGLALWMKQFHHLFFTILILTDLNNALGGYVISMRLIDTHVTTAEPTLLGWAAALFCYPPFNERISGWYFPFATRDGATGAGIWEARLADRPEFLILASLAILAMMTIYTWATVAFGLRFSNLTNRGIVCSGPYRVVRHPAYICKNLSWWIEFMPFLAPNWVDAVLWTLHLLCVSCMYGLRAFTEEWHLQREPHYREYCKKVRYRFVPGLF